MQQNGRFPADGSLANIASVSDYCRKALNDYLGVRAAHLPPALYEDFHGDLVLLCYELFTRWDKRKPFSAYAGPVLRLRVTDSYRREFVDARYHPGWQPPLSLDSPANGDREGDRLGDLLPLRESLHEADPRADDRGRKERDRREHRTRDLAVIFATLANKAA